MGVLDSRAFPAEDPGSGIDPGDESFGGANGTVRTGDALLDLSAISMADIWHVLVPLSAVAALAIGFWLLAASGRVGRLDATESLA
ncbi:MAG: hypothetical protein WDM77_10705 [Steroidobacteraceae bacterium]